MKVKDSESDGIIMEEVRMVGGVLLVVDFSQVLISSCRSALKCIKQENVLKGHTNNLRKTCIEGSKPVKRILGFLP